MRRALHLDSPLSLWQWVTLPAAALFVGAAATLLASYPLIAALAAAVLLYAGFAVLSLRRPLFFVMVFFVVLILLPPLFHSTLGEAPIYVSMFLLPVGLATLIARYPDLRFRLDPVAKGLLVFLFGTGLSLPFGFWLSGVDVGAGSLFRWLLLAQAALIYVLVRGGTPREESRAERWLVPVLVSAAALTAGYGVFDFFAPVPLPHPAAEQYIWLGSGILRRAQGVFFEASNFANLCAFFLLLVTAAFLAREERAVRVPRPCLWLAIPVLSLAVFVSFSRSAWGNVAAGVLCFAALSKRVKFTRGLGFLLALALPLAILWYYTPELWGYLLDRRLGNLTQILADPNLASSGRFDTWRRALSILEDHPQYLLFGVGYKTLPYTRLFRSEIIMDNGYMNLLLETGITGLLSFVVLSIAILKAFLHLARRGSSEVAFWGALLFALWCGQLVQMLATDTYTYWRNMIVFLALMGFVLNRAEREGLRAEGAG